MASATQKKPHSAPPGAQGKQNASKKRGQVVLHKPLPSKWEPKLGSALSAANRLGSFGSTLHDVYGASAMYSSTGSVTTKNELGIQIVDFFDYQSASSSGVAQFVHNYYWNVDQNLFANGDPVGGEGLTYCRPRKLCVWVLPQARGFGEGSAQSGAIQTNAEAMYTVNCQVPGISTSIDSPAAPVGDPKAFALNTQVTNVLPQFDTKWKKVLTADFQQTFKSGMVRPVFAGTSGDPYSVYNQCLFQMSIVNPQTGLPYQTGNADEPDPGIRVKVMLEIDQPIQLINTASLAVFKNEEFGLPFTGQNMGDFGGTGQQYVQMDLLRAQDLRR
jgi:hypothetical protein